MTPTASIVIPTFNRVRFLKRAIDAALAQTHRCEVVVCDHGSTDATPQLASGYGSAIRYVRREVDKGPVACWRDGVEQATGEFLMISYDDDWVEPAFVEKCLRLFDGQTGLVYTEVSVRDAQGKPLSVECRHPAGSRPMRDLVRFLLRTRLTISPGCALFRRKDVLENLLPEVPGAAGLFGPRTGVGEDLLLFLLTSLRYPRYGHLAEPLTNFTAHAGSITMDALSSKKRQALIDAYAHARAYYLQRDGSVPSRHGVARLFDLALWHLQAGTLTRSLRAALSPG